MHLPERLPAETGLGQPAFYKGYYMITARCNLDCDYCVLEDAPHQLRRELDIEGKIALVSHLYHRLGFRRLTFSGGEALIIGKQPPRDFIRLARFLRTLRSPRPEDNLEVGLYTNGLFLSDEVAEELAGVVDRVAITIDSADDRVLREIGRSTRRHPGYFQHAADVCARLSRRGIRVKLHTVVGTLNHARIGDEARTIWESVTSRGGRIEKWKFYQYMSYDDPARDQRHSIPVESFSRSAEQVKAALADCPVALHFKDNREMNASLFNILPYGNAQYMRPGDTWTTTRRTRDLREYGSMDELLSQHDVHTDAFRSFHALSR